MSTRFMRIAGLLTALAVVPCFVHAGTDPFYEERLREGKAALLAHDGATAADRLRIAVFGLLDSPRQLSEALVWLTLAHHGLGHDAEAAALLEKFVESERRSPGYDRSALPPDIREPFEKLLLERFPREVLAAVPSLAPLVGASPRTPPPLPPASATAAKPAPASRAPSKPETAAPDAMRVRPPSPPESPAAATGSQSIADRATVLIRSGKPAEAAALLTAELARNPGQRRMQILLLEASCLSSQWRTAAEQARALSPIADSEPVAMFYAAVALFETGDAAGARPLLERALPLVARTPFVQRYRDRILGTQPGS